MTIYTMGFTQKSAEEFFNLIKKMQIEMIVLTMSEKLYNYCVSGITTNAETISQSSGVSAYV